MHATSKSDTRSGYYRDNVNFDQASKLAVCEYANETVRYNAFMNLIERVVWYIEMNLATPLTLVEIAKSGGVSHYHLSRVFRTVTGLSVMAYVRARRLNESARVLACGEVDILNVALCAQFGSHEAFTRAFSMYFGVLPSTVRKTRNLTSLKTMEPFSMDVTQFVEVDPPTMIDREAFSVTGFSKRYTFENNTGIPALWQSFNERAGEIDSPLTDTAFGVCYDANTDGEFSYMAGLESTPTARVPASMVTVEIPRGRYAVFKHTGHISDLRKTVFTIWNKSLADAGLEVRSAPDFELYDARFNPSNGRGVVEVWIPVT